MMDGFGTGEKDKEVCVVYQDDDQKVQNELVEDLLKQYVPGITGWSG